MQPDYNPSSWALTKRLLGYMKPFMGTLIAMLITAFGREGIYSLVAPLVVMLIIDYVLIPVPGGAHWVIELIKNWTGVTDRGGLLLILFLIIVTAAALRGIFFVVHRLYRAILSQNILRVMRRQFYNALINKSFSYLGQVRTGQVISRVTSDMGVIDLFYSETVRESFRMTLQLSIALYILFTVNSSLALICVLPLPFIFVYVRFYTRAVRPYMSAAKAQFDSLNGILVEGITAQKLIKGYGQEDVFVKRFDDDNHNYVAKSLRTARLQALYTPSNTVITAIGMALVIIFGGIRVISGLLTLGEFVLFVSYYNQIVSPVRMYARLIDYYQDALVSARRVFEVIDIGRDMPEDSYAIELPRLKGSIEFKGVTFQYTKGQEILKNVDLKVEAGERVAVIGFVGSGKSALIELVPRFYDPSSGQVLIDGFDVKHVTLKSLRNQIGIVLQDIYIFNATIRDNISFGKPEATDDEVIQAAKAAQIHEYIVGLPKSYETPVGERGLTLSGGQRQRIAIARTLLMDPRILILDDSTSNVDAETEVLIGKAIDALLQNRTALIITQRASTCEKADKVIVIDEGRIVASGRHADLIKSNEKYKRLIESQVLTMGGDP
jgi:ABC-type multidrug transport system fused ATPase/permease subunit